MKKTILILAVVVAQVASAEDFPIVDTPDYKGAIVPAGDAARDSRLAKSYGGFWTPTPEQVAKAEARIATFLEASTEKYAPRERKKLKWFRRQYLGYTKDGEKRILCNFLPGVKEGQDPFEGLRRSLVLLYDRGPDYWKIDYRLEKDECEGFHVDLGY